MLAHPPGATLDTHTSPSGAEVAILELDKHVSVRALEVLRTLQAGPLIPQRVCTRRASLNHCLILEWTEETFRAIVALG